MLILLLKILLFLILVPTVIVLLKDLRSYLQWRIHYKKQGIPYVYIPVLGMFYYLSPEYHKYFENQTVLQRYMAGFFKKGDAIAKFRELQEKYKGHDIVAISGWESRPILLLLNQKLISEYILIENDVSRKEECYPMPIGPGFMATYGKKAMHFRGIINKCFHYE